MDYGLLIVIAFGLAAYLLLWEWWIPMIIRWARKRRKLDEETPE